MKPDCGHKARTATSCATCARNERYWNDPEFRAWIAKRSRAYNKARAETGITARYQHYRQKHGISPADFDQLCENQGNTCAICGVHRSEKRLVLDHDHMTGRLRGALCDRCNLGLHWMETDYPEKAIAYLGRYTGGN